MMIALKIDKRDLFFRTNIVFVLLVVFSSSLLIQPLYAQGNTLREDAKKAALAYAETQTREALKASKKAAVVALFKRLYNSGANKKLSRTLADVALSTTEINQFAESTADAFTSNDPKKVQAATEALQISLGKEIAKFAKTPALRGHLKKLMGKAGSIKEVSGLIGAAGTTSGNRALAEYAGQVLIDLTPAAGVVAFYKSAYGVMKYADDQFNANEMEDLYQIYKKNADKGAEVTTDLLYAGKIYGKIIRDRRMDIVAKNKALIVDAADSASPELIRRLTKATDDEIKEEILVTFKNRREKEKKDAIVKAKQKEFVKQAQNIVDSLDKVARDKYGKDWYEKHPYQLTDFVSRVRKALAEDGVLDPNNKLHISHMSRLMAARLVYGRNSQEAQIELENLKKQRRTVLAPHTSGVCSGDGPRLAKSLRDRGFRMLKKNKPESGFKYLHRSLKACHSDKLEAELSKLEKEYSEDKDKFLEKITKTQEKEAKARKKKKRTLLMKQLAKLNHTKFVDTLKKLNVKSPDPYLDCLCRNAGYGSPGTRQFYHPDTLGDFDERYSCQHPGDPCIVAGNGCVRYPLPTKQSVINNCIEANKIGNVKDKNDKTDPKSGVRLDDFIAKELQDGH